MQAAAGAHSTASALSTRRAAVSADATLALRLNISIAVAGSPPAPPLAPTMPVTVWTPEDLEATGKFARRPTFEAYRYHTGDQNNGTGFSISLLTAQGPIDSTFQYRHHTEANLIIEGEMIVTDIEAAKTWTLGPGSSYTLANTKHNVKVAEGKMVKAISIFNPPLEGDEKHDAEGSYMPPRLSLRFSAQPAAPWFAAGLATGAALTLVVMKLLGLGFRGAEKKKKRG